MSDILTETFLTEFFKYCSVAVCFAEDAKRIFDRLYEAFLLPENYKDKLYANTQSEIVREVKSNEDFLQFMRISQYAELQNLNKLCAHSQVEMLKIKGSAIKEVSEIDLIPSQNITAIANYRLVSDGANAGKLTAMRILGFLQCEGMFSQKSFVAGCKNFNKAAQWNSLEGILTALFYDESSRRLNLNRLYTVAVGTPFESVIKLAEEKYGLKADGFIPESKLLKKAFGVGVLKKEIYSSQYSRFLFSRVLRIKDKEQLLFAANGELLSETADLPLKLLERDIPCDSNGFRKFPLKREKEIKRVYIGAQNADLRTRNTYRPLCLVSDSVYLLSMYAEALTKVYSSSQTERIDVAGLSMYDLEPNKNNIFVRNCNEDADNVYFMFFLGDVNERSFDAAKTFLQSDKRSNFRLNRPSAVLDLGAILPVCFCDKANAKLLKPYCDVVSLASVTDEEKDALLTRVIQSKQKIYGATLEIDVKAKEILLCYSVDKIETLLDKIARFYRKRSVINVTADIIREINDVLSDNAAYGFGGYGYED